MTGNFPLPNSLPGTYHPPSSSAVNYVRWSVPGIIPHAVNSGCVDLGIWRDTTRLSTG